MTTLAEQQIKTLGRTLVVAYGHRRYQAQAVDCVADSDCPKRVRILCDARLQGKVLMPGEYSVVGFADEE